MPDAPSPDETMAALQAPPAPAPAEPWEQAAEAMVQGSQMPSLSAPTPESPPQSGVRIPVVAPDGTEGTIDISQRAEAEQSGYRIQSPEEIAAEKYGTLGQQAIGFGEEVAGGATADLSKLAEVKSGLTTPEAIAGRAQALGPVGRFVGSGLGFGTLWALTDGLGVGAEGAAGPIAEALGSKVAASAATMAAYGAGQSINDQMLGGGPISAEAVLIDAGLSGAVGGATEGLLGLAGRGAPPALDAAKDAMGNLDTIAQKALRRALVAGGADEDVVAAGIDYARKAADAGMTLPAYLKVEGEKSAVGAADGAAALREKIQSMLFGGEDNPGGLNAARYEAVKNALYGQPLEAAMQGADDFSATIRQQIDAADSNPNAFGYRAKPDLGSIAKVRSLLWDVAKQAQSGLGAEESEGLRDWLVAEVKSARLIPGSQAESAATSAIDALSDGLLSDFADAAQKAAAGFDSDVGWASMRSTPVQRVESLLNEFDAEVSGLRAKAARIAETGTGKAPEAFDVWKAGDRFRDNAQGAIDDWSNESHGSYADADAWIQRVSGIGGSFTKDSESFGPTLHETWSEIQDAMSRFKGADDEMLKHLGVQVSGTRYVSARRFRSLLDEIATDHAGLGSARADAYDEWVASARNLIDVADKAYRTMPEAAAPDRAALESMLESANEAKADALRKLGLGDAIKNMKGGSLSLGNWWFPAFIAHQFGVPSPLVPFVVAAYKAGQLVFRPRAAMEAYGKVASLSSKLASKINISAKGAAKALMAADYGLHGTVGASVHDEVERAVQSSLLGGARAATNEEGSARHRAELSMLGDPEVLGGRLSHAWSGLPPETSSAGVQASMRLLAAHQAIAPQPSADGTLSASDALLHGMKLHALQHPVETLLGNLADGNHDPTMAALVASAYPAVHQAATHALLSSLGKKDLSGLNVYAKAALGSFLGAEQWPQSSGQLAQVDYGSPLKPGSPGLPGGRTAKNLARTSGLARFKSDLSQSSRLPIDRPWKPA